MIKKLRRKFIVVAMCSVVGVLLLIVGTINIVNYNQIDSKSDKVIEMLASNNGEFPDRPPESDRWNGISPETPFEARYFTALLTDGEIVSLDMKRIAAITAEQASEIVKKLVEKGSDNGMYHSFKYTKVQTTDGTLYILLDCSKDLTTAGNLLLASTLISLLGVGVVFLLIIIISKFVLRPVEDGLIKQKRFITNASHDIKTPLSVISAETDVLNLEYGKTSTRQKSKSRLLLLQILRKN